MNQDRPFVILKWFPENVSTAFIYATISARRNTVVLRCRYMPSICLPSLLLMCVQRVRLDSWLDVCNIWTGSWSVCTSGLFFLKVIAKEQCSQFTRIREVISWPSCSLQELLPLLFPPARLSERSHKTCLSNSLTNSLLLTEALPIKQLIHTYFVRYMLYLIIRQAREKKMLRK